MECFTYIRNIQDLLSDGKTPYERRFGQPFKGLIFPFGSLTRIHQFGKKVLPGLFLGYALYAGGNLEGWCTDRRPWGVGDDGRIGNLLEKTQCERGDISQTRRIHFSNHRWTKRSGTENIHLDTGTTNSRRKSRRFSSRFRRVSSSTSWLISGCWWSDEWFLSMSGNSIYRHHVEPRVKLYSPREESFPIPLKYNEFPETHIETWMLCQNAASTTTGTSMGQEICLILGQVWLSFFY